MASTSSLQEIPVEALRKRMNVFRSILGVMGLVILGFVGFYTYLLISDRFDPDKHMIALIPPFMMLVAGLPTLRNLQSHKAEIARRQNPS